MARIAVNGIEIEYEVSGRGPAVLLTHGYSDTGRMWDGQRRALGDRYRLITWDMRGHGQTNSPDDPARYSADLTVADMRALLQHLGVDRAVVGGLSLGGYVSLAFALAHPEMVRALVIADSGPGYRNAEARAAWNARAHARAADLEARGLEALGASRAMREVATERAATPGEARETAPRHRSARGLAHAARGMLAQEGSTVIDGLASIRVPTLVIVGDQDEPFLAPSQYMAKKIPGARLVVIPGARHWANLDQPDLFNRALVDFLDALGDR
jgi:pimeloyl-ACP methyl ester carboxylesterase